jgi:hypothetical protein
MKADSDVPQPYEVFAICRRDQATLLVQHDHHRVKVGDRWGIMITYPWMPLEEAAEPLIVKVIFHPAPRHGGSPEQVRAIIFKHPLAPDSIQQVINQLVFEESVG